MARVAAVVAPDHEHQIDPFGDQLPHCVLPVLGRAADRVEGAEAEGGLLGSVTADHRCPQQLGDLERFAREHRSLVGQPDPLQVPPGIETWRDGAGEACEKLFRVCRPFDLAADPSRLLQVPNDEVMPSGRARRAGCGRCGLLMGVLAMNHGRESVAGIALHVLPDVEDRTAGGVHQNASDLVEPLHHRDRHAEGGKDDDVLRPHVAQLPGRLPGAVEETDSHLPQPPVHSGVVDDLAGDVDVAVGKALPRLVGVVNSPFDAVAETEFLRQAHRCPSLPGSDIDAVPPAAELLDEFTVVVPDDLGPHRLAQSQPSLKVNRGAHGSLIVAE